MTLSVVNSLARVTAYDALLAHFPVLFRRALSHTQLVLFFFFLWIAIIFGNDDHYFWETMATSSVT